MRFCSGHSFSLSFCKIKEQRRRRWSTHKSSPVQVQCLYVDRMYMYRLQLQFYRVSRSLLLVLAWPLASSTSGTVVEFHVRRNHWSLSGMHAWHDSLRLVVCERLVKPYEMNKTMASKCYTPIDMKTPITGLSPKRHTIVLRHLLVLTGPFQIRKRLAWKYQCHSLLMHTQI